MNSKIALIIGAGPAGLTAAYELLVRTDIKPVVLESSGMVGGIARTENYKGNRIDIGGHRFFSKSDRVMNWWLDLLPIEQTDEPQIALAYQGNRHEVSANTSYRDPQHCDDVMLVRNRKSRIYFRRKLFDYPLSFSRKTIKSLGVANTLLAAASFAAAQCIPIRPELTLEDFLVNRFGRRLYRTFFRDYTEKVWGVPCARISAEWGAQRIKGLSVIGLLRHAMSRPLNTDIAQKQIETSLIEKFLYPKYGPGQIWELCAKRILQMGGEIHFNARAASIHWQGTRITAVSAVDNQTGVQSEWAGDLFFSTMPIRDLVSGMTPDPPTNVREVAAGLVYRDFITVGLLVKKMTQSHNEMPGSYLDDNWIYIQEPDVHIGRLQIFNNWSPYLVADSSTVWLGLEYFCNEGDALWSMSDEQLAQFGAGELAKINLINADDVLDFTVIRTPKSYPAYFGTYGEFQYIRDFFDRLDNFYPLGRNGMHRYNNQDHSMLTAMVAVDNICEGRTDKSNIWGVNTEKSYHEIRESNSRV